MHSRTREMLKSMPASPVTPPPLIPFNQCGKWGFCNPEREVVIACQYDAVQRFHSLEDQELALVRNGLTPQDWRCGMINPQGEVCIPLCYSNLEPFSCGFAKMRKCDKSLYGYIDRFGQHLTTHEFDMAQSFSEGWAYVSRPPAKRIQEHGFLNTRGELSLSGRNLFDDAQPFQQGLSVVTHYAARGYFYSYFKPDSSFLSVHKPGQFSRSLNWLCSASPFENERAVISGELTGFAIIDRSGQMIADLGFDFEAVYPVRQGLIRVRKGPDTGYLDSQGNEVIPCMLDYARVRDFYCGLAAFQETPDGLWGFFDRHLEVIVAPKYSEVADFQQGLAAVRCEAGYAVLNTQGQQVVAPRYSYVGAFEGGLALAKRDGMTFYIDSNGVEYHSC